VKPPLHDPAAQALARWSAKRPELSQSPAPIAVAFSAGADSTALLLAAHALWPDRVVALHVHHGLQSAADSFEAMARATCAQLGVKLAVQRVDAAAAPGQSPEEAARQARYRALAGMASRVAGADGADDSSAACVLLGHHADDQSETLLLALSRGAGLPGLASMGEDFERHGMRFGRPLLAVPTADLRGWLQAMQQAFVEDPSNQDARFTRNRIRSQLMPAWAQCFPGFLSLLARSARHAAQAQTLLDELADIDLALAGEPPAIAALQSLSGARQANALRRWLRRSAQVAPSDAQLTELLAQIADCRTRGHHIRIRLADGLLTRQGEWLLYTPPI
jgi:tRNA(Ile)-lysidine synthase